MTRFPREYTWTPIVAGLIAAVVILVSRMSG